MEKIDECLKYDEDYRNEYMWMPKKMDRNVLDCLVDGLAKVRNDINYEDIVSIAINFDTGEIYAKTIPRTVKYFDFEF